MTINFTTFATNQFELFSACLALASFEKYKPEGAKVTLFVPEELIAEVETRNPSFKLKRFTNRLSINLKLGFRKGFNARNSFRVALKNLARKVGNNPMVYFAPTTIFHAPIDHYFTGDQIKIARAPDAYWPNIELYGPTQDELWQAVANFAGVKLDDWIIASEPINYWRRYPMASSRFIYLPKAEEDSLRYEAVSKELIDANLPELVGQERDLVDATLAVFAMRESVELLDVKWDEDVSAFENFIQLVLRMPKPLFDEFTNDVLETPLLKQNFKQVPRMRAFFYSSKLRNIHDGFDDIEQKFTMYRIDEMIDRREIDKQMNKFVRQLVKKMKEGQKENADADT